MKEKPEGQHDIMLQRVNLKRVKVVRGIYNL